MAFKILGNTNMNTGDLNEEGIKEVSNTLSNSDEYSAVDETRSKIKNILDSQLNELRARLSNSTNIDELIGEFSSAIDNKRIIMYGQCGKEYIDLCLSHAKERIRLVLTKLHEFDWSLFSIQQRNILQYLLNILDAINCEQDAGAN